MTGGNRPPVTEDTYIRLLPFSVIKYLTVLLDIDNKWEQLVVVIPKSLHDVGTPDAQKRYSAIQIRLFDSRGHQRDGSSTRAVLDDWGTQNTKVKHLVRILQESALYEAADYLSVNVLHGEKVPRLAVGGQNISGLPQPSWGDADKTSNDKHVSNMIGQDCVNLNDSDEKCMYGEKDLSYGSCVSDSFNTTGPGAQEHTYNSLLQDRSSDPPYNRLASEGVDTKAPVPVLYNRITSFDSGGQLSDVLKSGNAADAAHKPGQEHEETLQVRKFAACSGEEPGHAAPLGEPAGGPAGRQLCHSGRSGEEASDAREPGEADDGSPDTDLPHMDSVYMRTGSKQMEYQFLAAITDHFNTAPTIKGGRVIGTGGFGDVFLGIFKNGYKVAVKRLKEDSSSELDKEKQFVSELDALVKYHHKHIVRLYAYSIDGPGKCLVYEYLCNGSLEDRLLRKDDTPALPNSVRLSVLKGTAEGIAYLNSNGMVHRDLKSANVLLDENFAPKVGDFATARVGPQGNQTLPMMTRTVIGTVAYLAPEALNFDVSTKLDSYSFGVVILEVLTGLPAMDEHREERDIKSYVEETGISELLDGSGGTWSPHLVHSLTHIADKCTERRKKKRVNIEDITHELFALSC